MFLKSPFLTHISIYTNLISEQMYKSKSSVMTHISCTQNMTHDTAPDPADHDKKFVITPDDFQYHFGILMYEGLFMEQLLSIE